MQPLCPDCKRAMLARPGEYVPTHAAPTAWHVVYRCEPCQREVEMFLPVVISSDKAQPT